MDVVLKIVQPHGPDLVQATTYYSARGKESGGKGKNEIERLKADLAAERQRTQRLEQILSRSRSGERK